MVFVIAKSGANWIKIQFSHVYILLQLGVVAYKTKCKQQDDIILW